MYTRIKLDSLGWCAHTEAGHMQTWRSSSNLRDCRVHMGHAHTYIHTRSWKDCAHMLTDGQQCTYRHTRHMGGWVVDVQKLVVKSAVSPPLADAPSWSVGGGGGYGGGGWSQVTGQVGSVDTSLEWKPAWTRVIHWSLRPVSSIESFNL